MAFRQIDSPEDLKKFNEIIFEKMGFRYPYLYLRRSDVYVWDRRGAFLAGFVLCPFAGWSGFRSLKQIPDKRFMEVVDRIRNDKILGKVNKTDFMEYTGYFISDKSIGLIFTLLMVFTAVMKAPYFVLSFDKSKHNLAKYYGHGKPMILYTGPVKYFIQNEIGELIACDGTETVEILSGFGIIKIFCWRTIKEFKRCLSTLFRQI